MEFELIFYKIGSPHKKRKNMTTDIQMYGYLFDLGLVMIVLALFINVTAKKAAKEWEQLTGTIHSSKLSNKRSSNARNRGAFAFYMADIIYSYQVDGADFTGFRIGFGQIAC